jgi:hypothetical protein
LAISPEHFLARSAVTADALFIIKPTAMQISATLILTDFALLNTTYLLACRVSMRSNAVELKALANARTPALTGAISAADDRENSGSNQMVLLAAPRTTR